MYSFVTRGSFLLKTAYYPDIYCVRIGRYNATKMDSIIFYTPLPTALKPKLRKTLQVRESPGPVDKSDAIEEIEEVDLTQVPADTDEEDEFPSVDEILAACLKRSNEAGDNQYEIEKPDVVAALMPF